MLRAGVICELPRACRQLAVGGLARAKGSDRRPTLTGACLLPVGDSSRVAAVPRGRDEVVDGVAQATCRFIGNRRRKLEELGHATMAVNPFLNPLMVEMNGHESLKELSAFVVGGHLSEGHATGFGKLVDERIVAEVFGTTKLTGGFRRANPPYDEPMFGVIDHLVPRDNGSQD